MKVFKTSNSISLTFYTVASYPFCVAIYIVHKTSLLLSFVNVEHLDAVSEESLNIATVICNVDDDNAEADLQS